MHFRSDVSSMISAANSGDAEAAQRLETEFMTSEKLAVYGSLAPGKTNHHIVAPLGGEWSDGLIVGDLFQTGWGAPLGYWAFRPRDGGERIPVKVLTAQKLPGAWGTLDEFEGNEYRRILVPIYDAGDAASLYTVANLYAAAE